MIAPSLKKRHYEDNVAALKKAPFFRRCTRKYFIENQAQWGSIEYGWHKLSNMAYSGCGVIAVWNVLVHFGRAPLTGESEALAALISSFETFGTVWGGSLGTSAFPIFFYLKRRFKKSGFTMRKSKAALDRYGGKHKAFVVTTLNDAKNPTKGLHTVCITRDHRGYSVHNAYRRIRPNSYVVSPPYATLSEAIDNINENPLPMIVIGVSE